MWRFCECITCINVYTTEHSFDGFPAKSLVQWEIILCFTSKISGYRPSSQYTTQFYVVILKFSNDLQNLRCTLSVQSILLKLRTSESYRRMGFIVLSNISTFCNWQKIQFDKLWYLPLFRISYMTLRPLSACNCIAFANLIEVS